MEIKDQVIQDLSTSFDATLATQLVEEFIGVESSFSLGRWRYSELDGGRLCEVLARILYSLDSKLLSHTKSVDDCTQYILDDKLLHSFPERRTAGQMARVIRAVYKLRSQRNAVHVSPDYTADEYDARYVLESCRWLVLEVLRLFWTADKAVVVQTMKEICRFQLPFVRDYKGRLLVQLRGLKVEEEILILLYQAGNGGMTIQGLLASIPKDPTGIRRMLKKLSGSSHRSVIQVDGLCYITDLGIQDVESILSENNLVL